MLFHDIYQDMKKYSIKINVKQIINSSFVRLSSGRNFYFFMDYTNIRFDKNHNVEFYKTLQKRVRSYFKENNITRFGDWRMVVKTVFMLALYLVPFVLILTVFESVWTVLLMWILMGIGMSGVGLSIMHDANHGAYSKNKNINRWIGHVLFLTGGSDAMWRIQHNVLHHTYTNVTGMDDDIDPGSVMRFSPHEKRRKLHKYQHIYAWFLYGLMTIMWITVKDFKQLNRYHKMNLLETQGSTYARLMTTIIISKVLYYVAFLVLPLWLSPVSWYITVLGFIVMHYITGTVLGMIFQPAHVVPSANYPIPDDSGNIKADWAVSQLLNTANFAPKSGWFSWFVGGLNFQIEHHLFPNICHVHYKRISKIVKKTAEEYNLPYHSEKSWAQALVAHGKMLKKLGTEDEL